ncbi:transcription termination factor 4, mitochondrial-like isoform X2 [Lytechinus variegatus]|uniref:transcription termination factor 4, mitochondrial-like isoform X2 n=1 Tax=Lytechinus variegatus TaxID=7654 RepID=UPI001BB18950|nr:transcription termination factor 4, mitochondrial-like isoform X2 [Lytechinus variegatus]
MAGSRYLASPVLLKQILFCGELRRHVLFPLKSRQQGTILSSHIHHSTMGRLCSGGTSTEVIGNLFLSRKRRVCSPDVGMDRLLGNIDYLHMLGLNYRQLLKTLDGNARLWKASLQNLQSRVKQLRKLGFVEGQLQRLIADWPHILTMGSVQLNAVVKLLMEKCRFPRAEVLTILSDSPAVLKEDLQSIELRFQYCYFRMGIQNNSEMTQAKIFKYSLDHLRCRHLLLERLGLYAPPNNRGHFATKNPSLSRIIDSSDGRFTEKVAKITMEEYEAFSKILLEEIKVEQFNKDHLGGGNLDEFTDEDSHYDDSEDSIDSDSEFWDTDDTVSQTQPFDFDKVDYRKKR